MIYKNLIDKWTSVLESDIDEPLDDHNKGIIALLLENQSNMNNGKSPQPSRLDFSISAYEKYTLPLIRKSYSQLLAIKLCETIVSNSNYISGFSLKRIIDNTPEIINGSCNIDIHKISRSTININQLVGMGSLNHANDESLAIEQLEYQVRLSSDRELINTMKKLSNNIRLGGCEERDEDLSFGMMDGDVDYINEKILDRIVSDSNNIYNLTKIAPGNFVICSVDIINIICRFPQFKVNIIKSNNNGLKSTESMGTLLTNIGEIKIIVDYNSIGSYILVGLHGTGKGESGIAFVSGTPYSFIKQHNPSYDIDTICSKWTLVDSVVGSGHFYRHTEYYKVKQALEKANIIM